MTTEEVIIKESRLRDKKNDKSILDEINPLEKVNPSCEP